MGAGAFPPPPGGSALTRNASLQIFNLKPLQIVFPSRADPESPVIDLDLHLPLLCFRPEKVLQVRAPHAWARPPLGLTGIRATVVSERIRTPVSPTT